MLEGIATAEMWATDSGSIVVARDNGHPAPAGRLDLITGIASERAQLLFVGAVEGGKGSDDGDTELYADEVMLRLLPSTRAVIDIGKFPSPVGAFANRRLSTMNPLIGLPDGYPVQYPWGVQVSGATSRFDYRAALVSLPVSDADYVPAPSAAVHPALGGGVSFGPALRIGGSLTWGPYLSDTLGAYLPAGADWKSYFERVYALDGRYSRGYFELRGEAAWSSYDVPTQANPVDGMTWYAEVKQTWTPRLYTAGRLERNDYAFIRPTVAGTPWTAAPVDAYNAEVGVGFRITAGALLKVSYRRQWWKNLTATQQRLLRDGYALAAQLSLHFDAKDWFDRKR